MFLSLDVSLPPFHRFTCDNTRDGIYSVLESDCSTVTLSNSKRKLSFASASATVSLSFHEDFHQEENVKSDNDFLHHLEHAMLHIQALCYIDERCICYYTGAMLHIR